MSKLKLAHGNKTEKGKPEQLSDGEIQRIADRLANQLCDDDDMLSLLLVIAAHLMEHCHNWDYVDRIGHTLGVKLYATRNESIDAIVNYAEEYRATAIKKGGAK